MTQVFDMSVGKRIDCPSFANDYSKTEWYRHYNELAVARKSSEKNRLYKTSKVWKNMIYPHVTILDIDGWRSLPDIEFYWNNVPITHVEFEHRFGQCTIMHNKF